MPFVVSCLGTYQQSLISLLVGFHGQTPTKVLNEDERTVTDLSIPLQAEVAAAVGNERSRRAKATKVKAKAAPCTVLHSFSMAT